VCSVVVLGILGATTQLRSSILNPKQPIRYLELGETLGARAQSNDDLAQARQVLAMGATLAERLGKNGLAASCCIALADTYEDKENFRDAWDLALLLDPSRLSAWSTQRDSPASSRPTLLGAECLRLARNDEPEDAKEIYSRTAVREAIAAAAVRVGIEQRDVESTLRRLFIVPDRDRCRGRVFHVRVEDGESIRLLCPDHDHPIGGLGDTERLRMLLAIELECLNAADNLLDWDSASAMHQNQPIKAPGIGSLIEQYGIDPTRPYLVSGRWSAKP